MVVTILLVDICESTTIQCEIARDLWETVGDGLLLDICFPSENYVPALAESSELPSLSIE